VGDRQPLSINISAIGVAGIGGLGMVALVAIIAIAFPIARWVLLSGILGGGLLAVALIKWRLFKQQGPRNDLPIVLFPSEAEPRREDERRTDARVDRREIRRLTPAAPGLTGA
jgi:hypothetical protein